MRVATRINVTYENNHTSEITPTKCAFFIVKEEGKVSQVKVIIGGT